MPKKKGDKGGNPNPIQTEDFKAKKFKALPDVEPGEPLAPKPISIRLPIELDAYLKSVPNRTVWVREALREKMKREQAKEQV